MNKILFIIGSLNRGGAERVVSILANHYAKKIGMWGFVSFWTIK